jgi:hypothetical protein
VNTKAFFLTPDQFAEYVDFTIKPVGAQKIFIVTCQKSPQPAFVKHKKKESFFIRSGPSNRQLTTSQVLEYLKNSRQI